MREGVAQTVLLVRAFEEADRDGVVLSHEQRIAASRRAVMVTTHQDGWDVASPVDGICNEETVIRRARLLFNALTRRVPQLRRVLGLARLRSLMGPTVIVVAFVVGLASNVLGEGRHLNLLAFPLLGLLAWNLVSYFSMAIVALARRLRGGGSPVEGRVVTGLADWVVRFALWRSRVGWRRMAHGTPPREMRVTARAFTRFCALWHRQTHALLEARVRRRMHLGAAALAAGVVLGMYWKALAFEFSVTWESTLLGTTQVQMLLDVVLGPAALILGTAVPDVAPLEAPGAGDAAVWIHLWALTAAIVVFVPRSILAAAAAWRSIRLRANVPIDLGEAYYRRALADWRGGKRTVRIAPYSYTPPPVTLELLKGLLYDFFGTRAEVVVFASLDYGDDCTALEAFVTEPQAEGNRYLVLLFNLAQSPEAEVHGALLRRLKEALDGEHGRLLVVVDVSAYRARNDDRRVAERLEAWKRVVGEAGLELAHLDPLESSRVPGRVDEHLDMLRAALWPTGDVVAP